VAQPQRELSLGLGALHQSQPGASADITRTFREDGGASHCIG
jgi:hypothetical protein